MGFKSLVNLNPNPNTNEIESAFFETEREQTDRLTDRPSLLSGG